MSRTAPASIVTESSLSAVDVAEEVEGAGAALGRDLLRELDDERVRDRVGRVDDRAVHADANLVAVRLHHAGRRRVRRAARAAAGLALEL